MTPGVLGKIFLWWVGILLLAILNGIVRERFLIPYFGPVAGMMCSGILLSVIVLGVAFVATPMLHYKGVNLWAVGILWLLLTVSFEFTMGLAIQHQTLAQVLAAYTFKGGNLWPIVLVVALIAPSVAARIRGLH